MKKILSLVFLLGAMILSAPQDVYANENVDKILVWKAVPKEYVGQSNVYLHSDADPTGTKVTFDFESNINTEWDLYRACLKDMPVGNYWVTTSTSEDGSFMDSIGFGYPDTEQKSVIPNIDTNVSTVNIKPTNNADSIDLGNNNRPTIAGTDGLAQFFCVFDTNENIGQSVKNIENTYTFLFKEYILYTETQYGHHYDRVSERLFTVNERSGHFDDFLLLYQPCGYSLFEYVDDSQNHCLEEISRADSRFAKEMPIYFSKMFLEREDLFTEENLRYTYLRQLQDWGWHIVIDTRKIEYDENGNCITDFTIKEDFDEERVLLFPDLGDEIPNDLPIIGPINPYTTFMDEDNTSTTDTPNQDIDYGEERFENIPEDNNEPSSDTSSDDILIDEPEEPSSPIGIIVVIIIIVVILGAVIIIVIKTKKK